MPVLAEETAARAEGHCLVINHCGRPPELQGDALWQRVWSATAEASVWPAGEYKTVVLPLPQGKDNLRFCLQAAANVLAKDGQVLLYGENELGIRSADNIAQDYYMDIDNVFVGGHGRIWRLQSPRKDQIRTSIEGFKAGMPPWVTYPGLFAGGKLDEATELLLKNLPDIPASAEVLDFACGIGVIANRAAHAKITAVDNNPLALLATAENVPNAITQLCGSPQKLTGAYDFILSNPPIHEGKELSYTIVNELIASLPRLLKGTGAAYIVAQVTVPVARMAQQAELVCSEIAASRSFRITRITR